MSDCHCIYTDVVAAPASPGVWSQFGSVVATGCYVRTCERFERCSLCVEQGFERPIKIICPVVPSLVGGVVSVGGQAAVVGASLRAARSATMIVTLARDTPQRAGRA